MNKTFWKIVEVNTNGTIKTLFHGVQGSRKLERGKWLQADLKMVSDGGTEYLSGWHVLPTKEIAVNYLKRFTCRLDLLKIVPCRAKNLRRKSHSREEVYLAEYMKLL